MRELIAGIHQFQTSVFAAQREMFQRLAKGQSPRALFITCSDSRIDPNLITQTFPGDLFILRNIGNLVPAYDPSSGDHSAAAAIEYAVHVLDVKAIIVCGHTHCGAIKGLLNPESLVRMPSVKAWLAQAQSTRQFVWEKYGDISSDRLLNATIQENVVAQLNNLKTHPAVATRLNRGVLSLHGWIYQIETGEISDYDVAKNQFASVIDERLVPDALALAPCVGHPSRSEFDRRFA